MASCDLDWIKVVDSYKITINSWNAVADAYDGFVKDIRIYDQTYDSICQEVTKPSARLLEIGCGPGNITQYLLSKRPDFRIEGIDTAPEMIRLARENNPSATFSVMDCRELHRLSPGFDAVICGFTLPYLSKEDVSVLFKNCADLLISGGLFYFSAIDGDYEKSGWESGSTGDPMFVHYYREDFLRQELEKAGLTQIRLETGGFQRKNGQKEAHLIFFARKA